MRWLLTSLYLQMSDFIFTEHLDTFDSNLATSFLFNAFVNFYFWNEPNTDINEMVYGYNLYEIIFLLRRNVNHQTKMLIYYVIICTLIDNFPGIHKSLILSSSFFSLLIKVMT